MQVRTILAPNPGPFTGSGTNTYLLISEDECLIVDPGPVIAEHRKEILLSTADLQPQGVLVTHTHPDHAPLANPLAAELDVPAWGYAPGPSFDPDRLLRDNDRLGFGRDEIRVLYTPGHSDDHLCFHVSDVLFTGDHVMGGSTVVVEDMTDYLTSLRRLQSIDISIIYPGHGELIEDPDRVLAQYVEHRLAREAEIIEALSSGAGTVGEIVEMVYAQVDVALHPLAAMSVDAHLRKLSAEGRVEYGSHRDLWASGVSLMGMSS